MKLKLFIGSLAFLFVVCLFSVSSLAYASTTEEIVKSWSTFANKFTSDNTTNYVIWDNGSGMYVCTTSLYQIAYNSDTDKIIVKGPNYKYIWNGVTWEQNGYTGDIGTTSWVNAFSQTLGTIHYTTSTIYVYNGNGLTTTIFSEPAPTGPILDTSIPTFQNLTIKNHKVIDFLIFQKDSYVDYDIRWTPQTTPYQVEVLYVGGYNPYQKQDSTLKPLSMQGDGYTLFKARLEDVGFKSYNTITALKTLAQKVFVGDSYTSLTNRYIYFRYYKKESNGQYKYGYWTRLSLGYGADFGTGITEVSTDIVERTATTNGDGTITYTDTVITAGASGSKTSEIELNNGLTDVTDPSAIEYGTQPTVSDYFSNLGQIKDMIGQVPMLLGTFFTFLPPELLIFITMMIVLLFVIKFGK